MSYLLPINHFPAEAGCIDSSPRKHPHILLDRIFKQLSWALGPNRGTRILHIHSAEASAFCRLFRGFRCDSKAFRTLRITASGDPRRGAHYSDRFDLGKLFFEELFAVKNTFKKAFLEAANPLPASLKVARIIASPSTLATPF
ncbi:hypothetical protein [Microbulbifer magnicolonia]|uniref:hypothetical protein n=1 Tax=Microbulbifer magnicolonia TaxID=3109744 RepID=UPI002B404733|nr:hypothetical protein [Microbulbifer sp. GG15]